MKDTPIGFPRFAVWTIYRARGSRWACFVDHVELEEMGNEIFCPICKRHGRYPTGTNPKWEYLEPR